MYSVLFSRIEVGMDLVSDKLKQIIPKNSKIAIFPWAFPIEIDAQKLNNDFFKNEYTQNVKGKYFCIKERNVSNWIEYKEINNQIKNNIIFFNEFCN